MNIKLSGKKKGLGHLLSRVLLKLSRCRYLLFRSWFNLSCDYIHNLYCRTFKFSRIHFDLKISVASLISLFFCPLSAQTFQIRFISLNPCPKRANQNPRLFQHTFLLLFSIVFGLPAVYDGAYDNVKLLYSPMHNCSIFVHCALKHP